MFATADRVKSREKKSPLESPSAHAKLNAAALEGRASVPRSFGSRNNPISNRLSRQTADQIQIKGLNGSDDEARYKLKIRSSVRSKTNRNSTKLKS